MNDKRKPIYLQLTEDIIEHISEQANRKKMSKSGYVRTVLVDDMEKTKKPDTIAKSKA